MQLRSDHSHAEINVVIIPVEEIVNMKRGRASGEDDSDTVFMRCKDNCGSKMFQNNTNGDTKDLLPVIDCSHKLSQIAFHTYQTLIIPGNRQAFAVGSQQQSTSTH